MQWAGPWVEHAQQKESENEVGQKTAYVYTRAVYSHKDITSILSGSEDRRSKLLQNTGSCLQVLSDTVSYPQSIETSSTPL